MNTKRYSVALNKNVDYDAFWQEMEDPTSGLPHIPDRAVQIVNNCDAFSRLCEYALTDSEAKKVKQDPRVAGVEIPVESRDDIVVGRASVETQNFTKPTGTQSSFYSTGTNVNWGLIRHSNNTNVYGTGTTTTLNYNYALDGTGVDIVISDSGIQADHPEFQYVGNTTSRVQQINWADYVPALSTMADPYQDPDGHGTNVCGISAGKTYGWAKNSQIYSIVATGDNSASVLDLFTAVKLWHESKTNGRPTVLNMSWAVSIPYTYFGPDPVTATDNFLAAIASITYQGVVHSGSSNATDYGLLLDPTNSFCLGSLANGFPYPYAPYDVALEQLIESGVVVAKAAGNSSYKIDVPGGVDYNNSIDVGFDNLNYQRGFSPTATDAIVTGSIDAITYSATQDQRASYSCAGPGVDVYAAGTNIMSAGTSDPTATSYNEQGPYFLNNSYKQLNDTGTSMASPQVAGIACLYLQANPGNIFDPANSSTIKSWITSNGNTPYLYSTGLNNDYLDGASLLGGNTIIAYQPLQPTVTDAIEVLVGGIRVQTGYTIINNNPVQVQFDEAPPSGVNVTILVRRGVNWYQLGVDPVTPSNGNPLQITETVAARFLRGL